MSQAQKGAPRSRQKRVAKKQRGPAPAARPPRSTRQRSRRTSRGGVLSPEATRALALSSPCELAKLVAQKRANLQDARDPHSATNSTVQIIRGVFQRNCDTAGNGAMLLSPTLLKGINTFGDVIANDSWENLPGAAAAATASSKYRVISSQFNLTCNASMTNNGGSAYFAGLNAGMGQVDYRFSSQNQISDRTNSMRSLIDDLPTGSYCAFPVKEPCTVVIARQSNDALVRFSGASSSINLTSNGDAYQAPLQGADTIIGTESSPVAMDLRVQDLHPVVALAITGAPSLPYQIENCMIVEIVPATTLMGCTPGGGASAAGASAILNKFTSSVSSSTIISAEHGVERGVEMGLTALSYAGVPGAQAAAGGLHVAQALFDRVTHHKPL